MFEFIAYGNYNIIVMALERIALVMSDPAYHAIFLLFVVLSFFVWGTGIVLHRFTGGQSNMFSGIVIIAVGVLVYIGFINQTGDMVVEEGGTLSPRFMVIPDVPEGVRTLMGLYNGISQTIIPIIQASGNINTPEAINYLNNANGDIFNILRFVFATDVFTPGSETSGKYLNISLQNYVEDCIIPQMAHPFGHITAEMFSNGDSIIDILSAAASPVLDTLLQTSIDPTGRRVSCEEAGTQIINELEGVGSHQGDPDGTYQRFWMARCDKAGYFDPQNTSGFNSVHQGCQQKVGAFLATLDPNNSYSAIEILQTFLVSSQIAEYIRTHNVQELASYRLATSLKGEGSAAMKWIPILQGAVLSTYLGLMPFLALLIPTTIAVRVIKFIVGIFIFIICWDICDALLYGYAIDMAYASFRELMNQGMSLKMIWMMEGKSYAALLVFSKMRWAAMGMSAALSGIVVQSGAHILGSFGHTISMMGGEGQRAGQESGDPNQRAHALNSLPAAGPSEAIYNEYGFSSLSTQAFYRKGSDHDSVANFLDIFNGDVGRARGVMADATTLRHARSIAESEMIKDNGRGVTDVAANNFMKNAIESTTVQHNDNISGRTSTSFVVNNDNGKISIDPVYRDGHKGSFYSDQNVSITGNSSRTVKFKRRDGTEMTATSLGKEYDDNGVITTDVVTNDGQYGTIKSVRTPSSTDGGEAVNWIISENYSPYSNYANLAEDLAQGRVGKGDTPYDFSAAPHEAAYYAAQAVQRRLTVQGTAEWHAGLGFNKGINVGASGGKNFSFNDIYSEVLKHIEGKESSAEIGKGLQEGYDSFDTYEKIWK